MSASFYDLMRYAKTGIAAPDLTEYDKIKALAMCRAGFPEKTLSGVPPITFRSDGTALTAWSIAGNMLQTGTPTPSDPVDVVGCGVRTGNLFDKTFTSGYHLASNGNPVEYTNDARCVTLEPIDVSGASTVTFSFTNTLRSDTKKYIYSLFDGSTLVTRVSNQESGSTIDVSQGNKLYLCVYSSLSSVDAAETTTDIMLNTGSTPLPYEPYGYKLPLTIGGTEYPIYLGQVETTRKIKKLALDGTENFEEYSQSGLFGVRLPNPNMMYNGRKNGFCTHFVPVSTPNGATVDGITFGANSRTLYITLSQSTIDTYSISDVSSFKTYLAAQYAAGTPVTIWYVLATPETGIVNEPIRKIGDYADTITMAQAGVTIPTVAGTNTLLVDTTVQPSSMSITGKIREAADV